MDEITEDKCLVCRNWKLEERPQRRVAYFGRDGLILVPKFEICPACKEVHRTAQTRH